MKATFTTQHSPFEIGGDSGLRANSDTNVLVGAGVETLYKRTHTLTEGHIYEPYAEKWGASL
ncbi:MAG: hypothetical protein AAF865_12455 [Pseudomonadota bacterium]